LKTFLKYETLTADNIKELQKIKTDIEAWRKQNSKE
jgi:hypothetical protein